MGINPKELVKFLAGAVGSCLGGGALLDAWSNSAALSSEARLLLCVVATVIYISALILLHWRGIRWRLENGVSARLRGLSIAGHGSYFGLVFLLGLPPLTSAVMGKWHRPAQARGVTSPSPEVTRVVIADVDSDCNVAQKAPLKRQIRSELHREAAQAGLPVEVILHDQPMRADEKRDAALTLLEREKGQVLVWGGYACTQTDVEMNIRVEFRLRVGTEGASLQLDTDDFLRSLNLGLGIQPPRQAPLAELNSLNLQRLTAKSVTGLVILVMGIAEWRNGNRITRGNCPCLPAKGLRKA